MLKSYTVDLFVSLCIGYILRRSDPRLPLLHTHKEGYQLFSRSVDAVGESCTLDHVGESCTLGVGERGVFVQV